MDNVYRMDNRTRDQFIQDIKQGNEREARAIKLFKDYLYWLHGYIGEIKENGVDMSGEFIEDATKIHTGADYRVGANELPLEVKTSVGHTLEIYLKVEQVNSYIKQGSALLFVNGIERPSPAFTFFTSQDLEKVVGNSEEVTPPNGINGGKKSYKLNAMELTWLSFDGKERLYEQY